MSNSDGKCTYSLGVFFILQGVIMWIEDVVKDDLNVGMVVFKSTLS